MRHSLCLWLALAVLFAAWLCGNPFLPGRSAPLLGQPPVVEAVAPGKERRLEGSDAHGGRLDAGKDVALAVHSGRALDAAIVPVALHAPTPKGRPLCPDPELEGMVVEVVEREGDWVWVLRDGRRLRRNPAAGNEPGAARVRLISDDDR